LAVNVCCAGVAAVRLQYVGCDALGLVGTLHPQRHERTFERLVAGVRATGAGRKWRALRRRAATINKKQDFASFGHARRKIDNEPTMK
jgi:hypothetical protein